jgi:aryl sulfotransferase
MLRVLDLLVWQSPEPRSLDKLSPWIDRRFPISTEEMWADFESHSHRRIMKSHLPLDGLPLFEDVKYVHVARDGRDACLSYHNHITGFKVETLARLDREGLQDETIGRPYPRVPADPGEFFQYWLTHGAVPGHSDGSPFLSYFALERTYWEERSRPNLLLVHYNDLKRNLEGEMRRLAAFLDITIDEELLPALVRAAQFETMREEGDKLTPHVTSMFMGGAERFFNKGTNRRWEGVFSAESLALYQRKLAQELPADCAKWLENGNAAAEPQAA